MAGVEHTIGSIMDAYIKDREREGKQVEVMQYNWDALKPMFEHLKPDDLKEVVMVDGQERTLCHKYALQRHEAGIARSTIWTELSRLRTAMNWAEKQKLISEAPPVWVPSQGQSRDPRLSEVDVWRLFDACKSPHIKLAVLLALFTSARKSAIQELKWDRVDFERRVIDFRTDAERSILDSGSQKPRNVVAMNNLLFVALKEAKTYAQTKHVLEYNGRPAGDVKKAVARAVKDAGLPGRYIGLHALRHALASWLREADVDMRKIQRFLGHEKLDTTERIYAKANASGLITEAEVIEARFKRGMGK